MVHLAHAAPESCTTAELSKATQTPPAYLSKVIQSLNREGLLVSRRGSGGGVTLASRPEEVTILQVVNAVDPLQRINSCPLDLKEHGVKLCPLHRRLDDAYAEVEKAFAATTLAEVVADTGHTKPLCD